MEYLKNIEKVIQETNQTWTPPPNLKISDWSDNYRRLSPESSAEAGAVEN
jgi:phage terminase large subunit GpA-like protein